MIISEDFSENYSLKQQNEIMSANWSQENLSLTYKTESLLSTTVPKRIPAHPFLSQLPIDPACSLFWKSLFLLPYFLLHPILRNFRQFPPLSRNHLLPWSNQLTFLGLNKYQKGDFTSSTVAFYQKSIFKLLDPFTNTIC